MMSLLLLTILLSLVGVWTTTAFTPLQMPTTSSTIKRQQQQKQHKQHPLEFLLFASTTSTEEKEQAIDEEDSNTSFRLSNYFQEKLPIIEKALDESLSSYEPETDLIIESMKYSLMAGGKRIRPILCIAAAEMFDPIHGMMKSLPASVSLEMIHTMSLIHDDLPSMDNDDLRRGKPTNHVRICL